MLIGLVSVTGAVLTWRSAQLGEYATDNDRQSVAETVRQEQDAADDEIALQDARTRFADHAAAVVSAEAARGAGRALHRRRRRRRRTRAEDEAERAAGGRPSYLEGGTST